MKIVIMVSLFILTFVLGWRMNTIYCNWFWGNILKVMKKEPKSDLNDVIKQVRWWK